MADSVDVNPQHKIWGTTTSRGYKQTRTAGFISAGLFGLTGILILWAVSHPFEGGHGIAISLAFLWAIGAPVWFWYEYFFLYIGEGLPESFELYKHGQQLSIAIWAGLALSLGALAHSDVFKQPEKPCQQTTSSAQPSAPADRS